MVKKSNNEGINILKFPKIRKQGYIHRKIHKNS